MRLDGKVRRDGAGINDGGEPTGAGESDDQRQDVAVHAAPPADEGEKVLSGLTLLASTRIRVWHRAGRVADKRITRKGSP